MSIASVLLFTLCLVFSVGCFKTQELKWSIQCALVGQLTLTQAGTAHCVSATALKVFCNHVAVMAKSGDISHKNVTLSSDGSFTCSF